MNAATAPQLLSADCGGRRVTIGWETPEELRSLSDRRALTCPCCRGNVTLHAGSVRAHHFAHLPGAVCSLPNPEPETEEHRAGKLLLANWARSALPNANVIVEAFLPKTNQRADVLIESTDANGAQRVIALEFQCANLGEREWRRRHALYRGAGIEDLWILGGSRLQREPPRPDGAAGLRTTDLERGLLAANAPLLFLEPLDAGASGGSLIRFRPAADAQSLRPHGRLSARMLLELPFPWTLLDWPTAADPATLSNAPSTSNSAPPSGMAPAEWRVWEWLAVRYQVTPASLDPFFGEKLETSRAFACSDRAWQAAIYYRFVHRRVGESWWLLEIGGWARAHLPLAAGASKASIENAIKEYQELLGAAGMLTLPMGIGRRSARVQADLTTLSTPPNAAEAKRIARYRRTLAREAREVYNARKSVE